MLHLRPICPEDDTAAARVIRTVMPEFGCVGEGYSIMDPEVDALYETYTAPGAAFFVLTWNKARTETGGAAAGAVRRRGVAPPVQRAGVADPGFHPGQIVGVGGYAPLTGADAGICELRKMYLLPRARGYGGGRLILDRCVAGAKSYGYTQMYLETVTAMTAAAAVYQRYGFEYLAEPLGDTGHTGCDKHMIKTL